MSSELAEQAREMVAVLESDTRIDMNTDWKLITLSSGQTDLCHLSCKSGATDQDFVQNIKQALDILFTLPNIIIQVVSPLGKLKQSEKHNLKSFTLQDPSLIQSALHRPISCQLLTRHLCPCVSAGSAKTRAEFLADLSSYRQGLADLIRSGRYEGRTNAAVVLQTGLEHLHLPKDKGLSLRLLGLPDVSLLPDLAFLAPDCTHPSQKLHAISKNLASVLSQCGLISVSKIIWNGLFDPAKTDADDSLKCPDSDNPYFVIQDL